MGLSGHGFSVMGGGGQFGISGGGHSLTLQEGPHTALHYAQLGKTTAPRSAYSASACARFFFYMFSPRFCLIVAAEATPIPSKASTTTDVFMIE